MLGISGRKRLEYTKQIGTLIGTLRELYQTGQKKETAKIVKKIKILRHPLARLLGHNLLSGLISSVGLKMLTKKGKDITGFTIL